jgi:hypothetical protein
MIGRMSPLVVSERPAAAERDWPAPDVWRMLPPGALVFDAVITGDCGRLDAAAAFLCWTVFVEPARCATCRRSWNDGVLLTALPATIVPAAGEGLAVRAGG